MARRSDDKIDLGKLLATPMHARGEKDGRLYWRARTTDATRRTVWTGWGTRQEVTDDLVARLAKGSIDISSHSRQGAVRTVGELLHRWVSVQEERHVAREIAEPTLLNYRNAARHWTSAVADVGVRHLTRAIVEDTLRRWRTSGAMGARTAALDHTVLSMVVSWGAQRDLCPAIDLRRMAPAHIEEEEYIQRSYTPSRAEADAAIAKVEDTRYRALLMLAALTGARIGEVVALRVGSYDRSTGVLHLTGRDDARARRGKVKLRAWPVVGELGRLLEGLVEGRAKDEPLVVGLPRNPSPGRHLQWACDAAGVERFTAHALRRMVVMELLEHANAKRVSKLTGHSVQILLRVYERPDQEEMRDVVARTFRKRGVLNLVDEGE